MQARPSERPPRIFAPRNFGPTGATIGRSSQTKPVKLNRRPDARCIHPPPSPATQATYAEEERSSLPGPARPYSYPVKLLPRTGCCLEAAPWGAAAPKTAAKEGLAARS